MNYEHPDSFQILVCNIHWNKSSAGRNVDVYGLPVQLALDVPESILSQASKRSNDFNDIVEQFAYNLLTHKFNCEVTFCQVWLPLE